MINVDSRLPVEDAPVGADAEVDRAVGRASAQSAAKPGDLERSGRSDTE